MNGRDNRIDDIEMRLRELERYLPVLRENFAGEIGPPFPSMEDLIRAKMRENAQIEMVQNCVVCGTNNPFNHAENCTGVPNG